jgi:hypothetical protein
MMSLIVGFLWGSWVAENVENKYLGFFLICAPWTLDFLIDHYLEGK